MGGGRRSQKSCSSVWLSRIYMRNAAADFKKLEPRMEEMFWEKQIC